MKKKFLLGVSLVSALSLAACGNSDSKEIKETVQEESEIQKVVNENISVGFVTNIVPNEYVEISVDGIYFQYPVEDTSKISIGSRVEIIHEGEIRDNKIIDIEINEEEGNVVTSETKDKNVIYLDENGKIIKNVEEFKENIKKSKEENTLEQQVSTEQPTPEQENTNTTPAAKEDAVFETQNQGQNTSLTEIIYFGKADARTVEVLQGGEIKVMYLENDNISNQFDNFNVEQKLNVETYVKDGRIIIKAVK